ncbi:hypothetical protein V8F20_005068 [Naviculisporaceae sp. PSN 640]
MGFVVEPDASRNVADRPHLEGIDRMPGLFPGWTSFLFEGRRVCRERDTYGIGCTQPLLSPFPFAVTGVNFGLVRLKPSVPPGDSWELIWSLTQSRRHVARLPMKKNCAAERREGGNGVKDPLAYLWGPDAKSRKARSAQCWSVLDEMVQQMTTTKRKDRAAARILTYWRALDRQPRPRHRSPHSTGQARRELGISSAAETFSTGESHWDE